MQNSWDAQASALAGGGGASLPGNAAEFEESDSARDILADEMAAKLRASGCPAGLAPKYVAAIIEVLRAKDEKLIREDRGEMDSREVERLEATFREQLRTIEAAERPKLQARVYLIARGVEAEHDDSIRKVAAKWNLSPQGVKKMVDAARAQLLLPRNQFNKSEASCNAYRLGNRRNIKHVDAAGN